MFDPRPLCCSSLTTEVGGTTDTNFVDSAHPTVALITCSPPCPELSDLSTTARPCALSPDPAVSPPPQQPTARATAPVAAHCRYCRALVHPMRAQPTAPPSRALHYIEPCSVPTIRLDHRHGSYPWWFSL